MTLIRSLDSQRRLTLPQEVLRAIGVTKGDYLKVYAATTPDNLPCVCLEKFEAGCALCDEQLDPRSKILKGKKVCSNCVKMLT